MKKMATAVFMTLLTGSAANAIAQDVQKGEPVHIKSMDAKTLAEAKAKAEAEGKKVEVINQVESTATTEQKNEVKKTK